jgi:hypothetical protein
MVMVCGSTGGKTPAKGAKKNGMVKAFGRSQKA